MLETNGHENSISEKGKRLASTAYFPGTSTRLDVLIDGKCKQPLSGVHVPHLRAWVRSSCFPRSCDARFAC